MPQYKVYYKRKDTPLLAGDAYVVDAKNEADAKRQTRKLLLNRFGCDRPGMEDVNSQVVPKIYSVIQMD